MANEITNLLFMQRALNSLRSSTTVSVTGVVVTPTKKEKVRRVPSGDVQKNFFDFLEKYFESPLPCY
jgi:hypothetical protein